MEQDLRTTLAELLIEVKTIRASIVALVGVQAQALRLQALPCSQNEREAVWVLMRRLLDCLTSDMDAHFSLDSISGERVE